MADEIHLKRVMPPAKRAQMLKNMLLMAASSGMGKDTTIAELVRRGYATEEINQTLAQLVGEGHLEEVTKGPGNGR